MALHTTDILLRSYLQFQKWTSWCHTILLIRLESMGTLDVKCYLNMLKRSSPNFMFLVTSILHIAFTQMTTLRSSMRQYVVGNTSTEWHTHLKFLTFNYVNNLINCSHLVAQNQNCGKQL